jgi:hypothetical protein
MAYSYPPFVNHLARGLRQVPAAALVEHLTIPQHAALARFHPTPEGAGVMGSFSCSRGAVTQALEAAVVRAWGAELTARLRALSSAGVSTPPKEDSR